MKDLIAQSNGIHGIKWIQKFKYKSKSGKIKCPNKQSAEVMKQTKTNHSSHTATTKWGQSEGPQAVDRNLWWPPTPQMPSSETKHAITRFPLKPLSFFLLTSNRQTALWVLFYEIHIMLLAILDVISKSFRESTEFTALDGWEVQRDPCFLLLFGVLDSKLLLEEATAKIINQWTPIMTFCDVTMWINEAMKTRRTNTLGEIKSAKETEFWTHWSRLFMALNET